jgi:hypothetical protein
MFGRETDTRHERTAPEQPSREQQASHLRPEHEKLLHDAEEEAEREKAYGGVGELSDGDGPRSDLGTNPLPDVYWEAFPDNLKE